MFLFSLGFTPREIDEEWTWTDIEAFMTVYPHLQPVGGIYG